MRLNRVDTVIIKMLYLFAALVVVAQVLGMFRITSLLFNLTFPLVAALWISTARVMKTNDYLALITIVLAFLCVYINAVVTNTSISFSYIRKVVFFASTILLFVVADKVAIGRDVERWISVLMTVAAGVLVLGFFLHRDSMYLLNGRVSRYLTFQFANPNLTGMIITCLMLYQYAEFCGRKNVLRKLLHGVFFLLLCYFLYLTKARNSMLVGIMFISLAASIRFVSFDRERRLPSLIAFLASWWPLVFAWLYLQIVDARWLVRLLSAFISEGKLLDSRVWLWNSALRTFLQSPIIGAYSQISGGTGHSQMHNSHVDILSSYGPVVLVLACGLRMRILRNCRITSYVKVIYLLGAMSVIFLGMGEAALFSGGLSLYIIGIGMLFMANAEKGDLTERCVLNDPTALRER